MLPSTMFLGDQAASSDLDKARLFNSYFHSVFTKSDFVLPPLTAPVDTLSNISITEEEVYEVLTSLDPAKAMGLDNINPRILRACAIPLTPVLHHLFVMCLAHSTLPQQWKLHKIIPVFKSKDKARVENYRPISLLSTVSKLF